MGKIQDFNTSISQCIHNASKIVRKEEEDQKEEGTGMPDADLLLLLVGVSCVFCCSGDWAVDT